MIIDDMYKPMAFKAPPGDLEGAYERIQLLNGEDLDLAVCRQAQSVPAKDDEEATRYVKAAGKYCSNLIAMKFKNVEQFKAALSEQNWRSNFYFDKETMNFGPVRLLLGIAEAKDHKMLLWAHEEPYALTILGAKLLQANRKTKTILKRINKYVKKRCGLTGL